MKNTVNSILSCAAAFLLPLCISCGVRVYDLADYGLVPDSGVDSSPLLASAIEKVASDAHGRPAVVKLPEGRYDFYPDGAAVREYYISNHDQDNPKSVGVVLEDLDGITFDGQGSELVFHGRMLPVALTGSENCTLKNFSIDFEYPHIIQVEIVENDIENGVITYRVAPWWKTTCSTIHPVLRSAVQGLQRVVRDRGLQGCPDKEQQICQSAHQHVPVHQRRHFDLS